MSPDLEGKSQTLERCPTNRTDAILTHFNVDNLKSVKPND